VAAARFEYDRSDIWILEPAREVARRFTLSGFNRFPVWSPDGRVLMHSSSGRGWVSQETSGSAEEQPVISPGVPRDWSRDGRWVLYTVIDPETKADVWVLPVMPEGRSAPGAKGTPYLRSPFNESAPRFSPEPNPQWVAYNSDESGRSEVYVASFPVPRKRVQISTAGGLYPVWAANGRALYYVSRIPG
jgi:Tol biopolymer transport system component